MTKTKEFGAEFGVGEFKAFSFPMIKVPFPPLEFEEPPSIEELINCLETTKNEQL